VLDLLLQSPQHVALAFERIDFAEVELHETERDLYHRVLRDRFAYSVRATSSVV
jgi:hypothetical protein